MWRKELVPCISNYGCLHVKHKFQEEFHKPNLPKEDENGSKAKINKANEITPKHQLQGKTEATLKVIAIIEYIMPWKIYLNR